MLFDRIKGIWCRQPDRVGCKGGQQPLWKRFHVQAAFAVGGIALALALVDHYCLENSYLDYIAGLVTEFAGVAVTILLVDMALEQRSKKTEVRRMADELLFQVDYLVWIWLGGDRVFSYPEMMALLDSVKNEDILHATTETQFQNFGNEAGKILRIQLEMVKTNKDLKAALEKLERLASVRASHASMLPIELRGLILEALGSLDCVLKYTENDSTTPWDCKEYTSLKQSSEYYQYYRYTGMFDPALEVSKRVGEELKFAS
ncbi:hypothetical protein [Halodesulfovibrio sp. MK-HDV]|uniref:hypothetical protein n=1 Tax=Halodesulfovibrio sp. MK-HDV TaxID=2599925 RepID=UPI00136B022B|nr:hypothetical protein [Halodesulfovibrio sp. MK-HDV]KAF1074537.1 hypothetical protein MKHDV_02612 [Halodesulfovibrio sp. MK-HDV]